MTNSSISFFSTNTVIMSPKYIPLGIVCLCLPVGGTSVGSSSLILEKIELETCYRVVLYIVILVIHGFAKPGESSHDCITTHYSFYSGTEVRLCKDKERKTHLRPKAPPGPNICLCWRVVLRVTCSSGRTNADMTDGT